MAVEIISRERASRLAILSLGLDPSMLDVSAPEVLAELLRRTASFTCPTSDRHLVDVAYSVASDLSEDQDLRERLSGLLQELIGVGDLLELASTEGGNESQVYLGQPSFVRRSGARYMILGVRPEGAPLLEGELSERIEPEGHMRFVDMGDHGDPDAALVDHGLIPLSPESWLRPKRSLPSSEFVAGYNARLDAIQSGHLELAGAEIVDPAARVTYYRGRWRSPSSEDTGRFVGRRPQSYGSGVWMYVELSQGTATRAIDLPIGTATASRGADEAWRLMAALDHLAGHPQLVRVDSNGAQARSVLCLYSPLPSWMQRRLDLVGVPITPRRRALMCYVLPSGEVDRELRALEEFMWMKEAPDV